MLSKTAIAVIVILVVIILAETGVGLYFLLRPKKGNGNGGTPTSGCNDSTCPSSSGKLCTGGAYKLCRDPLTIARGSKDKVFYLCNMPTSGDSKIPSETPSSHGLKKKMCSVQSGPVGISTGDGIVMTPGAKWVGVTLYPGSSLTGHPYFDGWVPIGAEVISDSKTKITSVEYPG